MLASYGCAILFHLIRVPFQLDRHAPLAVRIVEIPLFVLWVDFGVSGLRRLGKWNKVLSVVSLMLLLNPFCFEYLHDWYYLIRHLVVQTMRLPMP